MGRCYLTATANGVPKADGTGKIDPDWVSATATPTAGSIPIADETGKLDADWLPSGASLPQALDTTDTPTFAGVFTGTVMAISDGPGALFLASSEGDPVLGADTTGGNISIGGMGAGASGQRVLVFDVGVAPAATDAVQMWAAEVASGNLALHAMTQLGEVVKLYRQAHIIDASGGSTVDAEARAAVNAILAVLENLGLLATS